PSSAPVSTMAVGCMLILLPAPYNQNCIGYKINMSFSCFSALPDIFLVIFQGLTDGEAIH
ncbi:MAG: hypothetical protein AB2809_00005, partial [Candidatus Thiodiazotropha sp.]